MLPRLLPKLLASAALVVLSTTAGCSFLSKITPWGGGNDEQRSLLVEIAGDSLMNNGNAANIVIYQLTNNTNFERTPLETFWQNDREALGEELVGSGQQVFLYPEQQKLVELDLEPRTRYLGVAANLREPEPGQWRRFFPLQEIDGKNIAVQVGTNRLTVQLPAAE